MNIHSFIVIIGAILTSCLVSFLYGWQVQDGIAICTNVQAQYNTKLISDGVGGAVIVWTDFRSASSLDLYAQRIDKDGTPLWPLNGIGICTSSSDEDRTCLLRDIPDGFYIAFTKHIPMTYYEYDVYAQRFDRNGSPLWVANGLALTTTVHTETPDSIISDEQGGVFISWSEAIRANVFVQRIDGNGMIKWNTSGVSPNTISNGQSFIPIVSDKNKGCIAVWRDGADRQVRAQRFNSEGSTLWNPNGIQVSSISLQSDEGPALLSDDSGGAFIVWSNGDIYAQKINSNGSILWGTNGVAICTISNTQANPKLISDGTGGMIIIWTDCRNDISGNKITDLYAQRISRDGILLWTSNGVEICTAANYQLSPTVISSGTGEIIITWQDRRYGGPYGPDDIYAQKINNSGVLLWDKDGVPICTAAGNQSNPCIICDGVGGAIIVWQDTRNGNSDIYAQRIDKDGSIDNPVMITKQYWEILE
jgi:hypothetical protein